MADDGNLSAEQTEKLLNFQEITQIESIDECKQLLEAFSWNVESAIQNTFNDQPAPANAANQMNNLINSQSSSTSSLNSLHDNNLGANLVDNFTQSNNHIGPRAPSPPLFNIQRNMSQQALPNINVLTQRTLSYHAPRPQQQQVAHQSLFQWSMFIVAFPFKFIFSTLVEIASFFMGLFEPSPLAIDYDPLANVAEFVIQYNQKHGTNHADFFQGSYAQAVNEAKRDLKFLIVYIHQNENQDCATFANETMTNPDLIEYLRNSVIFWGCSKNLPEGLKVYNALKVKRCPFLGVIVHKHSRMTLISKIEGPVTAAELMLQLSGLIAEHEQDLVVARFEKEQRNQTQLLRQEQDQAYQESLKADREKARKKQEQEEAKRRLEQLEQQKINDQLAQEQEIVNRKIRMRQQLAETPEPDASNPLAIKLLIKLPSGSRFQRIFLKTDPLADLYKFVFSNEECPANFEIAINFPHRVVECNESTLTSIQDYGINQSMLLFINDLDA